MTVETTSIDRITFPLTFIIFSWEKKRRRGEKRLNISRVGYDFFFLRNVSTHILSKRKR